MIAAANWRIDGDLHVLQGSRLTDALNSKAKDFIAVTDAVVYDATTGKQLFKPAYLAVNRDSIAVIFPLEDSES
ncbi:MAG: hypothetical protein FDZ75_07795 [Actinobacteria bacterium]|nr:MAG: hypothetical protein FDZ75_07795 [Actinomycetota bacterium]